MTYKTNDQVELEFITLKKPNLGDVGFHCGECEDAVWKFIEKTRLSDLEAIVERVNRMRVIANYTDTEIETQNETIDSILSYLQSLKQGK